MQGKQNKPHNGYIQPSNNQTMCKSQPILAFTSLVISASRYGHGEPMHATQCPVITPFSVDPAQLPDYLPIALVSLLTGLSVATIRDHCRKGTFPQPVKFTPKKHFWRKADILQFFPLQGKEEAK